MNALLDGVVLAAATAPLVVLGLWRAGAHRRLGPAALFLALLLLDDLLTALPIPLGLNPGSAHWNWVGKLLGIGWALIAISAGIVSRERVGLTWRQRGGSVWPATIVTLVLVGVIGLLVQEGQRPYAETLFYQATMPGIAEELAYRGIFVALLEQAFGANDERWSESEVWVGLVTSVAFGLTHGLAWRDGHVTFDVAAFAFPALGGVALFWLRRRTGSLLFPIIAHNGGNLATYVSAILHG
jgi:membrane protease YdiL (CAAX protease family)